MRITQHPNPLIRAALDRADVQMQKNPSKNSKKLLCLTARLVSTLSSTSLHLFYGLKHSGKYREAMLENLWNYHAFDLRTEQTFNRWLQTRFSPCAICSLFASIEQPWKLFSNDADEILQCSTCHVHVHRQCYENVCLAMNVQIDEEYQPWICQRCLIREQVKRESEETK